MPERGAPDVSPTVIAVDGPAASGKSTAARGVAERLGFHHLNSGILYRAMGWAALEQGWTEAEEGEVADRVEGLDLALVPVDGGFRVRVDGREPGAALRSSRVADAASRLSRVAAVRSEVNRLVRDAAARVDLVCDGRDVGTAIFPDAELKVFLTADPTERARRRLGEEGGEATPERVERTAARIAARDEADAGRELDPLREADDAVVVDTTELAPGEVVERIVDEAARRGVAPDREA